MSRRDPGAATGAIPREPGRCRHCPHLEPLHRILASRRTGCAASNCPCTNYEPEAT